MISDTGESRMLFRSILLSSIFCLAVINPLRADELKNFLLKFTDSRNYPYELLDDEYRGFFLTGDQYMSLGKEDLKTLYEEQNKLMSDFTVDNFRILSRSDTTKLTSVTYEYKWNAKVGNTGMNGLIEVHSILRKNEKGWTIIYDAVSQ